MGDEVEGRIVGQVAEKTANAGTSQGRARDQAITLMHQGQGCRQIARITGLSKSTVSRLAKENGHSFDRAAQMKTPLKARLADLQATKMEISERIGQRVLEALDDMDNAESTRDFAYSAKGVADLTRALKDSEPAHDQSADVEDAKDFLVDLRAQLVAVRDEFEEETGVPFDSDEAGEIIARKTQREEETEHDES
ncbi:helix-turn-helix domain-containing protein [Streptomyces cyaneofuscatus]|uniref:helix-turn-helix domain-containing protein n=1 Tax=Streptomyces cyaneofuscatus TaxID=66883 RepID=UPI00386DD151|nr:helix-turn-helix domain-containing protein [Streptomyces cyaneofuscatus]